MIEADIRNFLDLLLKANLALATNSVVRESLGGRRYRITWPGTRGYGVAFRSTFATLDEYRGWVGADAYSAILFDGALLQLTFDVEGSTVVGHRLMYYPCPFDIDYELLQQEPLLDIVEVYEAHGSRDVRLRSPLRFDFDPKAQSEGHAAAHLTMLTSTCRLPVVAPLSLGHFIRFVFRQFYPDVWTSWSFIREWPQQLTDRTITDDEAGHLHISCLR